MSDSNLIPHRKIPLPAPNIINFIASAYPLTEDILFSDPPRWTQDGFMSELDDLIEVVQWKAVRQKGNASKNDPVTMRAVTKSALQPFTEAASFGDVSRVEVLAALEQLTSLHGVQTRMASALLTVFRPHIFTVLDVRAWATLKAYGRVGDRNLDKWATYADYLDVCHGLVDESGVSLRNIDRYLYWLNGTLHEDYLEARRGQGLLPCWVE